MNKLREVLKEIGCCGYNVTFSVKKDVKILNAGVPIEVGFQKTEYAVSESHGSLALIVFVEGNVSSPFDVNVIAMRGTATRK